MRARRRQRMNELRHHDKVAAEHEDGSSVVCGATVVGRGEQGDEVALRKALKTVHDALMRSHDQLQVVDPAEVFHSVWAERDEPGATWGRPHSLHQHPFSHLDKRHIPLR